jgi:hypothetical protein
MIVNIRIFEMLAIESCEGHDHLGMRWDIG